MCLCCKVCDLLENKQSATLFFLPARQKNGKEQYSQRGDYRLSVLTLFLLWVCKLLLAVFTDVTPSPRLYRRYQVTRVFLRIINYSTAAAMRVAMSLISCAGNDSFSRKKSISFSDWMGIRCMWACGTSKPNTATATRLHSMV